MPENITKHEVVNHKVKEWVRGDVHTGTIDGYASPCYARNGHRGQAPAQGRRKEARAEETRLAHSPGPSHSGSVPCMMKSEYSLSALQYRSRAYRYSRPAPLIRSTPSGWGRPL